MNKVYTTIIILAEMRIWSLRPEYLDSKGLVALWREALLAKKVLEGKTKGYRNHPQLLRFKAAKNPLVAINQYLFAVYEESVMRGYNFEKNKIGMYCKPIKISVTTGQLEYEKKHLLNKLKLRDIEKYRQVASKNKLEPHPVFKVIEGDIEEWEVL